MKWILLTESYIPRGIDIIEKSFYKDYTNERFTPTKDFLIASYHMLNDRLFNGVLPEDMDFKIEMNTDDNASGHTDADDNSSPGKFNINYISLNGTIMMTVHSWLETIIHEMIHVLDFTHYPKHFTSGKKYDEHGDWFKEQAKRFNKLGFMVKDKLDKKDFTTSIDDGEMDSRYKNSLFIYLCHNPLGWDEVIKIHKDEYEHVLSELKKIGYKDIRIMTTTNTNSARLDFINVDSSKHMTTYHSNDRFKNNYGPFNTIKEIDLSYYTFDESNRQGKLLEDGSEDVSYLFPGCSIAIRTSNGGLHIKT